MFIANNELKSKENNIRNFPVGAEITGNGEVSLRVWAPNHKKIEAALIKKEENDFKLDSLIEMLPESEGFFSITTTQVKKNSLYKFKIDDKDLFPDPASRFQPFGPHGPSQVIDSRDYRWRCSDWKGIKLNGQILYEMHFGTFTKEGTYLAAINKLPELAELGITCIEVMPVSDFSGKFGWGYDGVNLFAPTHLYGTPDELKNFIDSAHNLGIGVILDVVYNHLGPDGNYLKEFSEYYFPSKHKTDWGEAINFDGENSLFVREYFLTNAKYWIEEFRFDGLRLDATQDIHDDSENHILKEIVQEVRKSAGERSVIIIAENEPQDIILLKDIRNGGYSIDALWNDDFHHSAMVAITGHNEAYYSDYFGTPQEFISTVKWGFLYQGQFYKWQNKRRGKPSLKINPERFITFIQNHDQVANSAKGLRAHQLAN